jgi:hypothetical protein
MCNAKGIARLWREIAASPKFIKRVLREWTQKGRLVGVLL